jgi:hypothetical protein
MSPKFVGAAGSPAEGRTAYQYRIDMKNAVPLGDVACVTSMAIDFGAIAKLRYDSALPPGDTYEITKDVPQNQVALAPAQQIGNVVTFNFQRPICTSDPPGTGDTSFFFGLASQHAPRGVQLHVRGSGGEDVLVKGFGPTQ